MQSRSEAHDRGRAGRAENLVYVFVCWLVAACGGPTVAGTGPIFTGGPSVAGADESSGSSASEEGATGSFDDDDGGAETSFDDGTDDGADGASADEGAGPWEPDPHGPAFIHADLWSAFWNDRTRCGAERTFVDMCQRRGEPDCSIYQAAYDACDPTTIVYGQVGPEQQGNHLCRRGVHPDLGGCVAASYDFDALRFHWYGAEWQGNWPAATFKVFAAGADWSGGGEIVAFSTLPGHAQAAMAGIDNHGLGHGCTMTGVTSGDAAYQTPFGAMAWVEVPTDQPVTVVAAAATNFGDQAFAGCGRGAATQAPWVTDAPGATLGCVYVQDFQFEPGHHYYWRYGQIVELTEPRPPPEIVAGFALPGVDMDVSSADACAM